VSTPLATVDVEAARAKCREYNANGYNSLDAKIEFADRASVTLPVALSEIERLRAERDDLLDIANANVCACNAILRDDEPCRVCSLRTQLSTLRADLERVGKEREALACQVGDIADDLLGMQELTSPDELLSRISKQAHEWRIRLANVQLRLDAAAVPDDPTAVTWRRESSRVDDLARDLDEHKAEVARVRDLASERREALEYAADQTAERIAAWLDEWDPSLADAIALHADMHTIRDNDTPDDASIVRHNQPSFSNMCLLVMAAIRAGLWRKDQP
jgi:hypothetical protein